MREDKPNGQQLMTNRFQEQLIRNLFTTRAQLASALLDPTNRDIDKECGYPETITIEQYRKFYDRNGIAKRVVRCLPEESWALLPDVYEVEDADETEFEAAWTDLQKRLNLFHYLYLIDELSGIGQFGVLLLGLDDGQNLDQPVDGINEKGEKTGKADHQLLYLRAFDESCLQVTNREADMSNPRYSLPTKYNINFQDTDTGGLQVAESITKSVHWSRVIHVADGRVVSEVYGTPRMKPVYNWLLDIRKVMSACPEMFWKGAFPGWAFEVNPELADQGVEIDAATMRQEFEAYSNGLQRYLALAGVQTKSLAPQVSDPRAVVDVLMQAIAFALSTPYRVLFGSERGELASSQDSKTWNTRVSKRNTEYVTPMILRPFIERLVAVGVLPEPKETLIEWPDRNVPTEEDTARVASARTTALAAYVQGGVDQLIPPEPFLLDIMAMSQDEVDAIMEKANEGAAAEQEFDEEGNPIPVQPQFDEQGKPIPAQTPLGTATDHAGLPQTGGAGTGLPSAFNGAQVQAAVQIVKDVVAGELPRESGIGQLKVFFRLSDEEAKEVMGTAGTGARVKPNPGATEDEGTPVPGKEKVVGGKEETQPTED